MLDLSHYIASRLDAYHVFALAEAVDALEALETNPARGEEYGPSVSDILQAAFEVLELAENVNDPVISKSAKLYADEVIDSTKTTWA